MIVWLALLGCADRDGDGTRAGRDCNDADPAVHVEAEEVCDGIDNNCNGQVDEGVALVAFLDRDRDGYGLSSAARRVCELPVDGALTGGDCDDSTAALHPGALERCDGVDNDCDGQIDEDLTTAWFVDRDGDGTGTGRADERSRACEPPEGYGRTDDDCDDDDPTAYVGAPEACDGVDNDCDGEIDEDLPARRVWLDADGDGAGDLDSPGVACGAIDVWSLTHDDCDDADATVFPGGTELLGDPLDNDCDGFIDERSIPHDYPTLDVAWREAPDGSIVQLEPGRTVGTWGLRARDLTLAGSGCGRTVLDGALAGTVLTMEGGRLANLTIENGTGTPNPIDGARDGGGLLIRGPVEVADVCFSRNAVSGRGGAIAVTPTGSATIVDTRFVDNRASGSGGGVWGDRSTVAVTRSHFERNEASSGSTITMDAGDLAVEQSRFVDNLTDRRATLALEVVGQSTGHPDNSLDARGTAVVRRSLFASNRNTNDLAVIRNRTGGLTVERTLFADNGGRVFDHDGALTVADNAYVGQDDTPTSWDSQGVREPADLFGDGWLLPDDPIVLAGVGPDHDFPALSDDLDRDGLPDGWARRFGVEPSHSATSDPDGDGLSHGLERELGTDPYRADSDDDGVDDGLEAIDADPLDPLDERPLLSAGRDALALTGMPVALDATAVHPRRRSVMVSWSVTDSPVGSTFTLGPDSFTANLAGRYQLTAVATSGADTVSDVRVIDVRDGVIVPDDHPDLETALAAVGNAEAVALRPGEWTVTADLGITLPARNDLVVFGLGGRDEVIVRPRHQGPVIALRDRNLHLADLTITGGLHTEAGGGLQVRDGDLTLERVRVVDNRSDTDGGGVAVIAGSLTARDSQVVGNSARDGGGLYVVGSVDLRDTVVESNQAERVAGLRLILPATSSGLADPRIDRCVFAFNDGPGAVVDLETSQVRPAEVSRTVFWHNDAERGVATSMFRLFAVDDLFEGNRFVAGTQPGPAFESTGTNRLDVLGLQLDDGPTHMLDRVHRIVVRTTPPDLRPTRAVRGRTDNVWAPRAASSVFDAGWVRDHDADGTRSDHARSSQVPLDGRWRLDVDRDGLSDGWEDLFALDSARDDSSDDADGDGWSAAVEHAAGTDPLDSDTDDDGVLDAVDGLPLDPRDHRPVARITPPPTGITVGEPIPLDGGQSSDPDDTPLTYSWRVTRSPMGVMDHASTDVFVFTPLDPGTYEVELTVVSAGVMSSPARTAFVVLPTLRLHDGASLSEAASLPSGSRVLLDEGEFTVSGPLPRHLVVEGMGVGSVIVGHAELLEGQLDLRTLAWTGGVGDRGGAITCTDATLNAADVVFVRNHARLGGAVAMDDCSGRWTDVDFVDNAAVESGGALYAQRGQLELVRGEVVGNRAGLHGGGFRFVNQSATVRNTTFLRNHAGQRGGGLAHAGAGVLAASHLTLAGNTVDGTFSQLTSGIAGSLTNSVLVGAAPLHDGVLTPTTTTALDASTFIPAFANYPPLPGEPVDLRALHGGPLVDSGLGHDRDGSPADRGASGGPDAAADGALWAQDTDGDGLPDGFEAHWGIATDGDADLDGLPDHAEPHNGTSPLLADTDGDGLSDGDEVLLGRDPRVNDSPTPLAVLAAPIVDVGVPLVVTATLGTPPYTWSLTNVPPHSALSIGPLPGTPMATVQPDVPGRYRFTVRGADGGQAHVDGFVRGTLAVPADHVDLQEALDAVAPYGTVDLAPGRYEGPFVISRPLVLNGVDAVLDGRRSTTLTIHADDVVLVGIELVGGRGTLGGGLRLLGDGLGLEDVTVRDNQAVHGGGLHVANARLDLDASSIVDNVAALDGGGLWVGGHTTAHEVLVAGNTAGRAGGGGLQDGGTLALDRALVVDNHATSGGGWTLDDVDADLQYCTFGHNDASPSAVDLVSDGSLTASDSLFVATSGAPLFGAVAGVAPTFVGGGFFDVDPSVEPFVLTPLDPLFDFGLRTDDADWTNDDWGRHTTPTPGPGAFGSP